MPKEEKAKSAKPISKNKRKKLAANTAEYKKLYLEDLMALKRNVADKKATLKAVAADEKEQALIDSYCKALDKFVNHAEEMIDVIREDVEKQRLKKFDIKLLAHARFSVKNEISLLREAIGAANQVLAKDAIPDQINAGIDSLKKVKAKIQKQRTRTLSSILKDIPVVIGVAVLSLVIVPVSYIAPSLYRKMQQPSAFRSSSLVSNLGKLSKQLSTQGLFHRSSKTESFKERPDLAKKKQKAEEDKLLAELEKKDFIKPAPKPKKK